MYRHIMLCLFSFCIPGMNQASKAQNGKNESKTQVQKLIYYGQEIEVSMRENQYTRPEYQNPAPDLRRVINLLQGKYTNIEELQKAIEELKKNGIKLHAAKPMNSNMAKYEMKRIPITVDLILKKGDDNKITVEKLECQEQQPPLETLPIRDQSGKEYAVVYDKTLKNFVLQKKEATTDRYLILILNQSHGTQLGYYKECSYSDLDKFRRHEDSEIKLLKIANNAVTNTVVKFKLTAKSDFAGFKNLGAAPTNLIASTIGAFVSENYAKESYLTERSAYLEIEGI